VNEILPWRLFFDTRPRKKRSRRTLGIYASVVKDSVYGT
jgi:hypothetical protein